MKKYLFIISFVGVVSGQYLTQKCQYDNKPLTKSFSYDNRKIELGKWYTKYRCTGIRQHEYWIPDEQASSNNASGGAEALGYAAGLLLGAMIVDGITKNKGSNNNSGQYGWVKDHYSSKDKNQKTKGSQKRKYKRPIRYKDMTKEGKQEYIRSCIVSFWVMAIIVQVIT